jgi:hypothetical protein
MDDSELKTESVTSEEFRSRLPITRDSEPTRTKSIQRFDYKALEQAAGKNRDLYEALFSACTFCAEIPHEGRMWDTVYVRCSSCTCHLIHLSCYGQFMLTHNPGDSVCGNCGDENACYKLQSIK